MGSVAFVARCRGRSLLAGNAGNETTKRDRHAIRTSQPLHWEWFATPEGDGPFRALSLPFAQTFTRVAESGNETFGRLERTSGNRSGAGSVSDDSASNLAYASLIYGQFPRGPCGNFPSSPQCPGERGGK